jgi:hypothetical protein
VAKDRVRWQVLVNAVMNLWVPYIAVTVLATVHTDKSKE